MLKVPGKFHIEVIGTDLTPLINEAGGHRIQRVPPTEKRGRTHTSTVMVAITDTSLYQQSDYSTINPKDLKIEWYSGTGAGGQNRNKVQNSCRLTHIPSGIIKTAQTRSRESSYAQALAGMTSLLSISCAQSFRKQLSSDRKDQMGSGMRGDKIRTYQFQHNIATDHRTEKKLPLLKIMEGNFNLFW